MDEGSLGDWYFPSSGRNGDHGGGEYDSGNGDSTISRARAHSGSFSAAQRIDVSNGSSSGTRLFRWREPDQHRELYYSAWFYFPRRMRVKGWFMPMQFKSRDATRNDPLWGLLVENDGAGAMKFYLSQGPSEIANFHQSIATIPVGKWFNLRAQYRCATDNTGYIRVWQDGRLIFAKTGIRTSYAYTNSYGNPWSCQWAVNAYGDGFSPPNWTHYMDDASISSP